MNRNNIKRSIIILITLILLCGTASAAVTSLNVVVNPTHITVSGTTDGSETVNIQSEVIIVEDVDGDNFEYIMRDYKVPGTDTDDTLTIQISPVDGAGTLTVGKTIIWDIDFASTAIPYRGDNVASYTSPRFSYLTEYISTITGISLGNQLNGKKINIKISGTPTSEAGEVTIKFIGKRTIDSKSAFSTSIKTDGFPPGDYIITTGSKSATVILPYDKNNVVTSTSGTSESRNAAISQDAAVAETGTDTTDAGIVSQTFGTTPEVTQQTSTGTEGSEINPQPSEPNAKGSMARLFASLRSVLGIA